MRLQPGAISTAVRATTNPRRPVRLLIGTDIAVDMSRSEALALADQLVDTTEQDTHREDPTKPTSSKHFRAVATQEAQGPAAPQTQHQEGDHPMTQEPLSADEAITAGLAGLAAVEACAAGRADDINLTELLDGLPVEAFTGVIISIAAQLLAAVEDDDTRAEYIAATRVAIARGDALPTYMQEER